MPRHLSLDLARGFTVLFITTIHCVMVYSSTEIHHSYLGQVLALIAEWPGAQLLLFVMGMSFSFSRKTLGRQLARAVLLWMAGYVLNFLKFVIPYLSGLLPAGFIKDLHFSHGTHMGVQLLLLGDVLPTAGICLLVLSLLKQLKYYSVYAVFLAYSCILCAPLFWNLHHSNFFLDHLLHLLGGATDDAFFPVFPWLTYPLIGMAIGNYLQFPWASILAIAASGFFLLVSGFTLHQLPFHFPDTSFWRTYPDSTIMHLGFVLVWIAIWLWLEPSAKRLMMSHQGYYISIIHQFMLHIIRALCFCSRHITLIYLLQWVLIFWIMPVFKYASQGWTGTILAIVIMNALVYYLVKLVVKKTV